MFAYIGIGIGVFVGAVSAFFMSSSDERDRRIGRAWMTFSFLLEVAAIAVILNSQHLG